MCESSFHTCEEDYRFRTCDGMKFRIVYGTSLIDQNSVVGPNVVFVSCKAISLGIFVLGICLLALGIVLWFTSPESFYSAYQYKGPGIVMIVLGIILAVIESVGYASSGTSTRSYEMGPPSECPHCGQPAHGTSFCPNTGRSFEGVQVRAQLPLIDGRTSRALRCHTHRVPKPSFGLAGLARKRKGSSGRFPMRYPRMR
jgi:hypothetical protein